MESFGDFPPFSFMNKLSRIEQTALHAIAHKHQYAKSDYIFRPDQLNDSIYILLEGRVKIIRISPEGRELIQWFCMPGEIFGLSEDNQIPLRGLYAQTISSSKLLCVPKQGFNQFLLDHPNLALLIVKQLASRLRTLGDMLLNITSDNAESRFVKLIQRLSDCYGCKKSTGIQIDVHLTHQEMADMIGVCRQTVTSMLGKLKREDILASSRNGIYIKLPEQLDNWRTANGP